MRYLTRLRLSGFGPGAIALGVAALGTLTPVRAWTEEQPGRSTADGVSVPLTTLESPWLASTTQLPGVEASAETCDPWSAAAPCSEDFIDPWAAETVPANPAPPPSEPVTPPPPPDLSLLLRGDDVRLEVGIDWAEPDGEASCMPQTAEVHVSGIVGGTPVSAHHSGNVSSLDAWVIDLGAPEAPYE